ncbi:hypothetical protein HK414_16265 [Ramlibacter terrae]|uniref:FAD-binding domain-containing protein n=1 Tax=Ramlibacter terrae TaxID=2732511 RepID=A0ABX6P3L4_9BURK|nr:hypothetical protein HK414_16265 [Ramlibacter terrae]
MGRHAHVRPAAHQLPARAPARNAAGLNHGRRRLGRGDRRRGPCGLTLANALGLRGVRTLVLERLPQLIDYPRGVGMDDESLRSFRPSGWWSASAGTRCPTR